jgi:HK97 gp10 family phage protein
MPTKVTAVGLKEANRALRRLPVHVKDEAQKVADVTAFNVFRDAVAHAPRSADGSHQRPAGFLARSIRWASRPRSLSAVVQIAAEAFYWKYLEFGTRYLSARPFFRPAADKSRVEHQRRMAEALTRAGRKVASEGLHRG